MGYTAKAFRELLHRHHLCVPSTFQRVYPTFYGQKNRTSFIDYLVVPLGLRKHVTKCVNMTRLAKKLQLAPGSGALLDHAP
eukprot:9366564-Pyramimonas_sp.AAC.1